MRKFSLKRKYLQALLSGTLDVNALSSKLCKGSMVKANELTAALNYVSAQIARKRPVSRLHTQYQRTVFEAPYDDSMQLTLDTDIYACATDPAIDPRSLEGIKSPQARGWNGRPHPPVTRP